MQVKLYLILERGIIINFHRVSIGIVTGMIVCVFLVALCLADDCGCVGLDTVPPDYGWTGPVFSSPDSIDSTTGVNIR
jgi:hypothetical protein